MPRLDTFGWVVWPELCLGYDVKRAVVRGWTVVATVVGLAAGACSGGDSDDGGNACAPGSETCACYGNGTCDDDLTCLSSICVFDPDSAGSGGRRAQGGSGSSQAGSGDSEPSVAGDDSGPGTSGGSSSGGRATNSGGSNSPRGGSAGSTNGGGGELSMPDGPTPVERYGQLSVSGTNLVDDTGAPVKLEGMSSMWLNWEPTGYALSKHGLAWMRDNWNLRIFRIAMGVHSEDEPENTYLADPETNKVWVNTIVQNAIDTGVYVIIDWHDHDALSHQSEALAFFDEMSEKWGDSPNVLYEVFNEPLDLDWSSQLKPYHEAVVATIRGNDPDNVILLGTPNWDQDVDIAAQDPLSGNDLMYTLHFYACSHQTPFRNRAQAALAAGLPLFVSEWGATDADGGVDGLVCDAATRAWHDWMDAENISWTAWKLDGCSDSSCMFKDRTAPVEGGWTSATLNGHAPLVIDEMKTGLTGAGGSGSGGTTGTGGSGNPGTGGTPGSGIDLTEKPEACALVITCPSCCETAGVFALDNLPDPSNQTDAYTTAWNASSSQATASFDFPASGDIGAIFFKFSSLQSISALEVVASSSGAPTEVALVRDGGASGCVYIEDALGWYQNGCWGTPDGLFDQLEVRVRSTSAGDAMLTVEEIHYE